MSSSSSEGRGHGDAMVTAGDVIVHADDAIPGVHFY